MNDNETPNPYNRNKEWQDVEDKEFVSSDSLFKPTRTQTPDPAPAANQDEVTDPYKTRYDELKRHHDSKIRDLKQELEQTQAQLKAKEPVYVPPKTPEEIAEFREKNPEIYEVLETEIHNRTAATAEKVDRLDEREKKILKREAIADIKSVHADFDTITSDKAFHDWAAIQSGEIQKWIYENPYDGSLAAKAITLYKAEKGIQTDIVQDTDVPNLDEDAATLLPTRSSGADQSVTDLKVWRSSELNRYVASLSPAQFERFEPELESLYEQGRVVEG